MGKLKNVRVSFSVASHWKHALGPVGISRIHRLMMSTQIRPTNHTRFAISSCRNRVTMWPTINGATTDKIRIKDCEGADGLTKNLSVNRYGLSPANQGCG